MELLPTLSPSASHCIKCLCNFIRILCLCRCQSAVKLKLQTEILHFYPQWKLRKSIFFDRRRNGLTLSVGSFSVWVRSRSGAPVLKGRKESAVWSTRVLHDSQEESFWAFLNVAHFSFSLFLWVHWGCAGEASVLERCRNFNMMLTLTFQGFLVGREDSWR